jgi:hypothetical protein
VSVCAFLSAPWAEKANLQKTSGICFQVSTLMNCEETDWTLSVWMCSWSILLNMDQEMEKFEPVFKTYSSIDLLNHLILHNIFNNKDAIYSIDNYETR